MLIAALAAPSAADASTYRWQVDAAGNWNDPANWALVEGAAGAGYPNLAGDVAVFDEPLTADRVITIPDTVTITIGRLSVTSSNPDAKVLIDRAGTGQLIFDNQGEDAVIERSGPGQDTFFITPIQLAAHVIVNGAIHFSGISEIAASRNVTITGGNVMFGQANTYTGTTTVVDGQLRTAFGVYTIRIPGPLVVGDGTGAAGSAVVTVGADSTDPSVDVLVNSDGLVHFLRNTPSANHRIDGLTVAGGSVTIAGVGSTLTVQDVTMESGQVVLDANTNVLRLAGSVTATGSAAIRSLVQQNQFAGTLVLLPGNHEFTIADGPHAIDFAIQTTTVSEDAPGAGLTKSGPGVMQISGSGSYTGATTLAAGTLIVLGQRPDSAVTVNGGRLLGTGQIGALTATSGVIAPGESPGSLGTGNLTLGAGSTYEVEIAGSSSGSGSDVYDRLAVTGTVNVTGATLAVASTTLLPPDHVFQIVSNDGSDPVQGTFAGLPEGATITTASGARFVISYHGLDGNDIVLTNITPVTYYLSEGATGSFFDEDILIANPNADPAPVTLTFLLPGGGTHVEHRIVPAYSRLTIDVNELPGLEETSPSVVVSSDNRLHLAVERTMMWDQTHYGGHTANAVTQPERTWHFAEGAQGSFFQTYLLLANANNSEVTATVTFLRENAPPVVETFPLAPQSRRTIYAGDYPALADRSFGMTVEAPQPITAERAMYFASTPGRLWNGGTGNTGVAEPSTSWYHPEGASGTFFTTFILLSNPQDVPAAVTLRFLTATGQAFDLAKTIEPKQRISVNPAAEGIPGLTDAAFATVVSSNVPVVSERAMYWPGEPGLPIGEGHASSGLTSTARRWALAEGRVGGPEAFATYILIANPETAGSAFVLVRFLRENGRPPLVKEYNIAAGVRFNLDVATEIPELQNESFGTSIEVMIGSAIAVERSLYWNANGVFWAGGTNALGSRLP
jgi:autotransporter-associated beta strand protein